MPKSTKAEEKTEQKPSINTGSPGAKALNKRRIILALCLLILSVATGIYVWINRDNAVIQSDNVEPEDTTSLASYLEDIEFDDSLTQEEISSHNLSVGAAFFSEGDYDKALEYYLKAERASIISSRLFADVAFIYEQKGDMNKRDEYIRKQISYLENELADSQDNLGSVGNLIAIGNALEKLDDNSGARNSYQKALNILDNAESVDDADESIQESREFLEEKLSE